MLCYVQLARYCDTLLKKSVRGSNDTETDDKLAQSITVFKYLDDKDIYNRVCHFFLPLGSSRSAAIRLLAVVVVIAFAYLLTAVNDMM